jgi:hypothetical protein
LRSLRALRLKLNQKTYHEFCSQKISMPACF